MLFLLFVFCYGVGTIPWGRIVSKYFHDLDIREHGSGNIGATNVWRVLGWKLGLVVLLLDFLKGFAIFWLVPLLAGNEPSNLIWTLAGLLAIMGHLWPIWSLFKGGKGAITSAGVMVVLLPLELIVALATFLIIVFLFEYISLGSIIAALAMLISHFIITSEWFASSNVLLTSDELPMTLFTAFVCLAVIYAHRKNIGRLWHGEEPKFKFKKSPN